MSHGAEFLGGAGWLLGARIGGAVCVFVQGVVTARALGPGGFGVVAMVTGFVFLIAQLFDVRSWDLVTRWVPERLERGGALDARAVVTFALLLEALTAVAAMATLIALAGTLGAVLLPGTAVGVLLPVFALWVGVTAPQRVALALLRLDGRFAAVALWQLAIAVVRLAAMVVCVTLMPEPSIVLVVMLAAAVTESLGWVVLARGTGSNLGLASAQPTWSILRPQVGELGRFALTTSLTATSRIATTRLDVPLLGLYVDAASVGCYRLARQLLDEALGLANPVNDALFPMLSRSAAAGRLGELRSLLQRITLGGLAVALVGGGLVALLAPWFVPAIFGEEYRPAVLLVQILAGSGIWLPLLWVPAMLTALSRVRQLAILVAIDALAATVLLLVLLELGFGVAGAATATLAHFWIWTALLVWTTSRGGWLRERRIQ